MAIVSATTHGATSMVDEDARQTMGRLLSGTSYRPTKRIGGGGMGEIYEAVEENSEAPVAVKLLRADLLGHGDLVDRMRFEGAVLRHLSHPNIVAGRGFGKTDDGRPYVAMERLKGKSLRQMMRRSGAVSLERALDVAMQLLSALAEVHAAGIVHRDIKPDNIMLCAAPRRDVVKLLDFGIAKSIGGALAPPANATLHGACVGTPRYTAPEQAKGGPIDGRADLYAVGLVLYALLAGRGPFDDVKEAHRILEAHVNAEPPPPSRFAPLPLPPALEAAVLRALAKNPEDRFADATSFRRELAMILGRRCIPLGPWLEEAHARRPRGAARAVQAGETVIAPRFDLVPTRRDSGRAPIVRARPNFSAVDAKPPPRSARENRPAHAAAVNAAPAPVTRAKGGPRAPGGHASATAVSSFEVLLSAAAFAAAASGVAMWFVH